MSLLTDVDMLKRTPLPEVRETIAEKISQYFNAGIFEDEERIIACDIIRLLARDAERRVRQALSENIKHNPEIPHDVVVALAQDETAIALPVLEFSSVLTEGDLIQIVRSVEQVAKLTAIARRKNVSEVVSSALVHKHHEEVIVCLFQNSTARISEESFESVIKEFKKNGNVIDAMIDRGDLPLDVIEKIITFTSDKIKEKLERQYHVASDAAKATMDASREQVTLGLLYDREDDTEKGRRAAKIEQLVKQLQRERRLTQSIVLRSLCEGNLEFFESSMAILAGVPLKNAKMLVRDQNPVALESLCRRANVPTSAITAVNIMIRFALKETALREAGGALYRQALVEHIVERGYDRSVPLMPYIMALIGSKLQVSDVI